MDKLTQYNKKGIEDYLLKILGDDPVENRKHNYLKALNGIGIDGVRQFIINMLEQGIPSEIVENSYFHPNKFFKLGICRLPNKAKLRMHFWNRDHLQVETPIHFHAWDFASMLLAGSYTHEIFSVSDVDEKLSKKIEWARKSADQKLINDLPKNIFGLYHIPKRSSSEQAFQPIWVKDVKAEKFISRLEKEGSSYYIDRQYPHRILIDLKEVGAMITLIITSETHPENLFTFQPLTKAKMFNNPSPNVCENEVRRQLELILTEINRVTRSENAR